MRKAKTNHKYPVYMTKGELHALHNGMTLHPDFKRALDAINKAHRAIVKDEEERKASAINREAYNRVMRAPTPIEEYDEDNGGFV